MAISRTLRAHQVAAHPWSTDSRLIDHGFTDPGFPDAGSEASRDALVPGAAAEARSDGGACWSASWDATSR